jgi:hypothetical protein
MSRVKSCHWSKSRVYGNRDCQASKGIFRLLGPRTLEKVKCPYLDYWGPRTLEKVKCPYLDCWDLGHLTFKCPIEGQVSEVPTI